MDRAKKEETLRDRLVKIERELDLKDHLIE